MSGTQLDMQAPVDDPRGALYQLPNGTACFYVDADHSYWRARPDPKNEGAWIRGKRLTGVTTAIKPIDFDPGRLLNWAAKTNGIGIAQLAAQTLDEEAVDIDGLRSDLAWLRSADAIWDALQAASLTFDDVRDQAATRGSNVHELALQALATGKPTPDYAALSEEEAGYANAVSSFWLDYEPQPLQVEQVVYSEDLGVAGRMDLRATIPRLDGIVIVDAKTSKYIGEKDHVQLAGYEALADICGIGASVGQHVLQVRADGTYLLIPGAASSEDFLAAVDLYRRRARIQKDARAAWAVAKGPD